MHIYSSTINGTLNRTTILLVLLIVMSLFLPATAIKYASGSPENSTAPPSGFTENNAVPLEDSGIVSPPGEPPTPPGDSGIVSPPGEEPPTPPGEEIAPPSGFTENNAAPPSGFRIESNSTRKCNPECEYRRDHPGRAQPRARSSWSSAAYVERQARRRCQELG